MWPAREKFRASGRSKLWENRLYQSRGFFKDKWIVSLRVPSISSGELAFLWARLMGRGLTGQLADLLRENTYS